MRQARGTPLLILPPHPRIQPWTSGPGSSGLWPPLPVCLALAFSPSRPCSSYMGARARGGWQSHSRDRPGVLHCIHYSRGGSDNSSQAVQYIWEMGTTSSARGSTGALAVVRETLGSTGELQHKRVLWWSGTSSGFPCENITQTQESLGPGEDCSLGRLQGDCSTHTSASQSNSAQMPGRVDA